jgi:methylisocitrate lyase
MATGSAGGRFRAALEAERPLQVVGAINAFCGLLAEQAGFRALYLSGAGVANASFGLPDLGLTSRGDVVEDARRITGATQTPLLVDADTGWGDALGIARTVRELIRAGAAGMHLEDQIASKRCGHRPGKALVSAGEMAARIKAALDGRFEREFLLVARTDALAVEGLSAAVDRACRYVEAGADLIFAEAVTELDQYRAMAKVVGVPILANLTEFGRTPLWTIKELAGAGVQVVLYPLTAFRAMSAAAQRVYQTLRRCGTQRDLLPELQTREELYRTLNYQAYEKRLDDDR